MKLNYMLFLFGLIPRVSADFSLAKNTKDDPISRSSFDTNSSLLTVNKDVASFGAVRNEGQQGNFNLRGGRVLQGGCPAGKSEVVVTIDPDCAPDETYWEIVNKGTLTVVAFIYNPYDGVHTESYCLPGGDYTFTIYDTSENGMNGGSYKLSVDDEEKFNVNGNNFGHCDSIDFTVTPAPFTGCPAGLRVVVLTIDTDCFPGDTSWKIFNKGTSTVVASGGDDDDGLPYDGVHTWYNCLPDGDYTFTIYDSWGDGLYADDGSYKLSVDGVQKFNVNGFLGDSDSIDFSTGPNSSPNAICKNVDVDADNSCQAQVDASAFDNGSTDANGDTLSFSVYPAGPYDLGTTSVTLTVSDGTLSDTCSAQVTLTDITPPKVTCKDYSIDVSSGSATLTVDDIKDGNASDNCGVTSEEIEGLVSFTCDNVGSSSRDVTLKVQDAAGNTSTCTSTVTATNVLPVVDAGDSYQVLVQGSAGITFSNGQLNGSASGSEQSSLTYAWTTTCPGATITRGDSLKAEISIAAGTSSTSCSVTLAVTDVCAATVEDTTSVSIVYENSSPNAICQANVAVDADNSCQAQVDASAFDNGSTDANGDTLSFSVYPAGPYGLGTTPVTLTVSDGTASDTCSAQVTVLRPPTLFTSNNLEISFSGIPASISYADLASLIAELETITKEAIRAALLAEGVAIDANDINIASTVVRSSSRKLGAIDSTRSLQGTLGVEQDVNVNAPATAVNTGTISDNVLIIASENLSFANVNLVAVSIVYEEPPWPCSGVTCSNAGKCEVLSHTEALCRCENTFVPSESGLECICPDGLAFHANVNRCLPPPTAAPSDLPSVLPSLTPSSIPSDGKIDEEDTPSCVDDMSDTFKLFNIMEEAECSWLTKNKDKTKVRKNKYCVIDEVKSLCQSTCGVCTGCDDKEGTFTLLNMKKRETCAWLTKSKLNAEKRKNAYCVLDEVCDMCKASCNACAVEDESGRV